VPRGAGLSCMLLGSFTTLPASVVMGTIFNSLPLCTKQSPSMFNFSTTHIYHRALRVIQSTAMNHDKFLNVDNFSSNSNNFPNILLLVAEWNVLASAGGQVCC
jgi:ATP adenylyltransferase/5',5'''-P-1,P-4-tetraphosphate phosphorylase II